jgi:hypothetical protein
MRVLGIVLIVLGVIGLAYGGFTYTRRQQTVNLGPLSATVREKETIPFPPIAGAIAVVVGAGLFIAGGRRRA